MLLSHCERGRRSNPETALGLFRHFVHFRDGAFVSDLIVAAAIVVWFASFALAAFNFPALTGRVVDQAGVMNATSRANIDVKSKELEDKSGTQLVVATVKSLQGSDIETYANQLFRFWKLGEAKKNNGVLLLIAPAEHKVRIEVGYGLEGTLTDALSSVIISTAIVPRLKTGDFSGGIERGVDGIISVLSGDCRRMATKGQCSHRRELDGFRQAVSIVVFRGAVPGHVVPDPSRRWRSRRRREKGWCRPDHPGFRMGRWFRWRRFLGRRRV